MKTRAFTLVEMLVVVAIIMLLISMLLPSLGRAKDAARRLECVSHLHAQGVALGDYSSSNAGQLPIYDPNPATGPNKTIADPVIAYRVGEAPGETAADTVTVRNHGILYQEKLLPDAEFFYCPTQRGSIWQQDLYVTPWLSGGSVGHLNGAAVPGSTWLVRSAYLYSPHRLSPADNRRAYLRLNRFPNDKALMMDLLFATQQYDTVAHDKDTAWNVLHPDLSVKVHKSNWVMDELGKYGRVFWPEFEPILNALLTGSNTY